ncbi:MAG: hypothetical protein B7Z58_18105 [Acidiphilium sp. 37-64-53]|uniref:hypothetical protein n=1 Tax=Acidiphilium sp. 37-64-53 TaxID=1970299 RepID=UPI000BCE7054|nr:hypothetical protein [Acidiphilium sp. 37-64-53]OYV99677.1 MAG: hypothetical protein B7Z58_18105 [Acidiphilium sp. 37-64-53]
MTVEKVGNGAKQRARRAELMIREGDPLAPHAAFRKVGGANDPDMQVVTDELAATRLASQVAAARAAALEAELDVAKKATTTEQKRNAAIVAKAQISEKVAADAQKRAEEALGRAKKAEIAVRQVKTLPGIKGRLVRWLVGDVLRD